VIADFLARTAVWIAFLAVWVALHKSQDAGWFPTWAGMPNLVGGALVVIGVGLYVAGAVALARIKRNAAGTPNQLIVEGSYRYVRNPVYLAIVIIIVGLSLLYQAWQLPDIVRTGILFAIGHLAVVFVEEPATRKRFGEAYEEYCRRVPRWVPRFRPPQV